MVKYCGYKKLDKALADAGDRDMDMWMYIGSDHIDDKYGKLKLDNNKKKYKNMKDVFYLDKCICGVEIKSHYFIMHTESYVTCGLGSVCIEKWEEDAPGFTKDKCLYCGVIMKKRNKTSVHQKCKEDYDISQKIENNICLKCDCKIGNKDYDICYKCRFRQCDGCKRRNVLTTTKYRHCFHCNEKKKYIKKNPKDKSNI